MQFASSELMQGQAASSNMISRLSELLFIEAVRSQFLRAFCTPEVVAKRLGKPH